MKNPAASYGVSGTRYHTAHCRFAAKGTPQGAGNIPDQIKIYDVNVFFLTREVVCAAHIEKALITKCRMIVNK